MHTRRTVGFAVLALFVCSGLLNAQTARPTTTAMDDLLKSESRWKIIGGLEAWNKPLSDAEIALLDDFAQKNKGRDWTFWYCAQKLLRTTGNAKYAVSPKVEQAEKLFAGISGGKVPETEYDERAVEVGKLGAEVMPLLLDLVAYTELADSYRKRVAIKALALSKDERIVPALRDAAARETNRMHFQEELLALLTQQPTDEMTDYAAGLTAKRDPFDQEYTVRYLSSTPLSKPVKMRLYSHLDDFKDYGRHAVVRALAAIDDAEAFQRLCGALRKYQSGNAPGQDGSILAVTVRAMGGLENSDPCPPLLEALKVASDNGACELVLVLGERKYAPSVPAIESRMRRAGDDTYGLQLRYLCAGALCRMAREYDKNAAVVREGLEHPLVWQSVYGVVPWLNDEETVRAVAAQIGKQRPPVLFPEQDRMTQAAIVALGKIGSKSAVPALRDALGKVLVKDFALVGDAIAAIGKKSNDQPLAAEGEGAKALASFLSSSLNPSQRVLSPDSPEAKQAEAMAAEAASWLKQHRELIPKLLEELQGLPPEQQGVLPMLKLLDMAWDPTAVPYLERLLTTDQSKVSFHTERGVVPHYYVRSAVAEFLTKKTGKEYTFKDADGTVRKGGERPK